MRSKHIKSISALLLLLTMLTSCFLGNHNIDYDMATSLSVSISGYGEKISDNAVLLEEKILTFPFDKYVNVKLWAMPMENYDTMYSPKLQVGYANGATIEKNLFDCEREEELGINLASKNLILFHDFDGDGCAELLTEVHSFGSEAIFIRIFKITEKTVETIFKTDTIQPFDFGFRTKINSNKEIEISNTFTDYQRNIRLVAKEDTDMYISSGYDIFPYDIDDDDIYEFGIVQSVYLDSEFAGWAFSIVKYDNKLNTFNVIKAHFFMPDEATNGLPSIETWINELI